MIDVYLENGDMNVTDSVVNKAANVLETPINYLNFAPDFGIDHAQFFNPDVEIQFETFKAYTVQRLVQCGVNVVDLQSQSDTLDATLRYFVEQANNRGLVA